MKKLMKKFDNTRAEKNDSYWGVQKPLEETRRKMVMLASFFLENVSCATVSCTNGIMSEAFAIHKDLEFQPKPKDRTALELANDFFSEKNNPILFQIRITRRIEDLNQRLDHVIKDCREAMMEDMMRKRIALEADLKKLMKKYHSTRARKDDTYWGVQQLLEETKLQFETIRKVDYSDPSYLSKVQEACFIGFRIHKDLKYEPKPEGITAMEMVKDFKADDDGPVLFIMNITSRIEDLNHKLDQILKSNNSSRRHNLDERTSMMGSSGGSINLGFPVQDTIGRQNQYNASRTRQTMFPTY